MQGPFNPDVPKEMGYQLPLVPKQIYNLGIADAEAWCQDKYHKTFAELSSEQQDEALGLWESGKAGVQTAAGLAVLHLSAAKHPRRVLQRPDPWRQ